MTIKLLLIGKTDTPFIKEGMSIYSSRIKHYTNFEIIELIPPKAHHKLGIDVQKEREGELIFSQINPGEQLILLDEKGKEYSSTAFAGFIQKKLNSGGKAICFAVGGPFGFSTRIVESANAQLSLSKMTFTHEMVRLFFLEQLYRAHTILKGEKYHHD